MTVLSIMNSEVADMLSGMSPEAIVRSLPLEVIARIQQDSLTEPDAGLKVKRPVNAFMAFRSYYFRIFRSMQQKQASVFLTILWAEDPVKHRWAVIAKTYSFVRDEMNGSKVRLGPFLKIACPLMAVLAPENYLHILKWRFENRNGELALVQNRSEIDHIDQVTSLGVPNTELDLLTKSICYGYAKSDGSRLIAKMATNQNFLMAVDPEHFNRRVSPEFLNKRLGFLNGVRQDPIYLAANLIGSPVTDALVRVGVNVHFIDKVNRVGDDIFRIGENTFAPKNQNQAATPDELCVAVHELIECTMNPAYGYPYPGNEELPGIFDLDLLGRTEEVYDIRNPFDYPRIFQDGQRRADEIAAKELMMHHDWM